MPVRLSISRVAAVLPLMGALILAAILFPVFARARENARRASCQSNLKQIALGFLMYSQDYDGAFPPDRAAGTGRAARTGHGWTEALLPYTKSVQIYRCPTAGSGPAVVDYNGASHTDYFFNRRLAGYRVNLGSATSDSQGFYKYVVLNGDGEPSLSAAAAHYSLASIPPAWISSETSPSKRHLEGANYSFADGHVKWIRNAALIGIGRPGTQEYTFAPR